jgi:alpha-glucosidase
MTEAKRLMNPDWLWWRDGAIYHIYLRSFADSNGDGLGDLPGLIHRLDYLRGAPDSLGIDAIWLSPCFPSPDKDFGYDVADYTAIDPRYGTLADFDRLIAEAHRRGIRVLLDLVYNHTSDQHAWFLDSRSSRGSAHRDWYVWRDGRRGGPPNNWQSVFGGKAWTWDQATQQYYYHMFLEEQPDLNWRHPDVRRALMDATRFWLDRGVDGFRLDVFNTWYEDAGYQDNPAKIGLRGFDRQRHVYDVDQAEMHTALAEFRALLDAYPERTSVGELFGADPELAASYCSDRALHMVFNFEFTHRRWNPQAFCRSIERAESLMQGEAWPCYVLSNHDLPRHVTRYGGGYPAEVARVAAAVLLTQRGTPFLYYGEEIGLPDVPLRRDQILDPPGRKYWPIYRGRDANRAPLPWDDGPQGGFTSGTPWLPLRSDFPSLNVAAQRRDPRSVWSFYRDLLRLRRETPALRRGAFERASRPSNHGLAYLRSTADQQILVALNFGHTPARLAFEHPLEGGRWSLALAAQPERTARLDAEAIDLDPFQAAIYVRKA